MIEPLAVTLLPVAFLIVLFGGGELFRRRRIDMGGTPPIAPLPFAGSKYAIVALWAATALHSWGVGLSVIPVPQPARWLALALWGAGFLLLLAGRLELGGSFRIGSPREHTTMQTAGLFRFSRNPMYLGVFATLIASVLYTMNPVILLVAVFVVAVHHRIVLAEEQHLHSAFGEAYLAYCQQVRRYL
jgi:protein-S-isoprenylcysteine O-methyltransferase Ste14